MICPKCGAEYRRGFVRCGDCGTPLESPPPAGSAAPPPQSATGIPPEFAPPLELVTVFRSGSLPQTMIAESILRSAGIEYLSRGSNVQSLFGVGGIGGMNLVTGPMLIEVRREDARDAAELLEHLARGEFDEEVGLEWEDDEGADGAEGAEPERDDEVWNPSEDE